MPADTPTAVLIASSEILSPDVKMPGKNARDVSDSARSVAIIAAGAVRSATAYHRAPTRHLRARETYSRTPARPVASAVNARPVTLGPASIAISANTNRGSLAGVV